MSWEEMNRGNVRMISLFGYSAVLPATAVFRRVAPARRPLPVRVPCALIRTTTALGSAQRSHCQLLSVPCVIRAN